jgi:uncharacterized protein (TIRG00374 family)
MDNKSKIALQISQYVIGLVAFGWLLLGVEWGRVRSVSAGISVTQFVLIGVVTLAGLMIRAWLWSAVSTGVVSLRDAFHVDLTTNFINHLIPSRASGQLIAPLVLQRKAGIQWSEAVAISILYTGLYAVLYGFVTLLGVALVVDEVSGPLLLVVAVSGMLYGLVGAGIFISGWRFERIRWIGNYLVKLLEWVPALYPSESSLGRKIRQFGEQTAQSFRTRSLSSKHIIYFVVGWFGAVVIAPGLRVWLLLAGTNSSIEPIVLLPIYLVMAYSVTVLPITPGGIGITEVTATLVFVALGVPEEVIIPVIFIDRLLGVYLPAAVGVYPTMRLQLFSSDS